MPKIRCLIVDDEPLARRLVAGHASKLPSWVVVGQCRNAIEAHEMLQSKSIDVLFLDVNMPVINGVDFFRSLLDPPYLVFTTAYPEYAIDGFDLDAVDYILKPVTFDRFLRAAERVQAKINQREQQKADASLLVQDHLFIKSFGKLVRIPFADLLYIEAKGDYVRFLTKQRELFAAMTMGDAESILPNSLFLRVHRSYIVSFHAITSIFGNTIEVGEFKIPIGANYKNDVMKRI